MNLGSLRQEVLDHGFDPTLFGVTRINQYINDGLALICRRVDYYVDEATYPFNTVRGTASYPWPADFARGRSLFDTTRNIEMQTVSLRDIDRSAITQGAPVYYALDGASLHLYPPPDGPYPLELRYWKTPAPLVADLDAPTLPVDWHHILWVYAVWICYEADDDAQMGQYWMQRFMAELAEFAADTKFPTSDLPNIVSGMWDQDRTLGSNGWSLWLGY